MQSWALCEIRHVLLDRDGKPLPFFTILDHAPKEGDPGVSETFIQLFNFFMGAAGKYGVRILFDRGSDPPTELMKNLKILSPGKLLVPCLYESREVMLQFDFLAWVEKMEYVMEMDDVIEKLAHAF